ncbi:MAG: efflux RND transporter periplasmic adaptor subunit [Chromatiales bacterium]
MFRSLHALMGSVLICVTLSGCSEPPPAAPVEVIRPVKSFLIETAANGGIRTFPARIDAGRRAELAFRVSGMLKQLPVKEGDEVEAGQLVAALDPTDLQIVYNNSKAGYDNAERNFTRAQELIKKGNISKMDYDRLEAEYKSADAALKTARQNLNYTKLTAPFSGRVARRHIETFEEVQAKQPIIDLQDTSELEVKFDVPESLIRGLKAEGEAKDEVTVSASFSDIPGRGFPLAFREITTQADAKTQTFRVTYTMTQPQGAIILPGMTAMVRVDISRFDANAKPYTVPASAIVGDYKLDPQAWIIDEKSMTVQPRPVKVGRLLGEYIEVFEGLRTGERIVTAGTPFLVEGMKVRLMPEREQAAQRPEDLNY